MPREPRVRIIVFSPERLATPSPGNSRGWASLLFGEVQCLDRAFTESHCRGTPAVFVGSNGTSFGAS